MYFSLKTNPTETSFLLTQSNILTSYVPDETDLFEKTLDRELSEVGSDSYKRSLRRAFARAKLLAFMNPDLNQFITFTYKGKHHTHLEVIEDIKKLSKQHKRSSNIPFKYIYVMEYQKRGSIHVHMIANNALSTYTNKNMHTSIKNWNKGFTSVLTISDFDENFRPYLYLFKYMSKAQRIGSSFIHVSRNFDKISTVDYGKYQNYFQQEEIIHTEDYAFTVEKKNYSIKKEYYRKKA